MKRFPFLSAIAASILAGCAAQMVQSSLKEHCAKDGKQAFLIGVNQTGVPLLVDSATATGVCVGAEDIVHLPDSFGADVIRLRISGESGVGVYTVAPGSVAAKAGLKVSDFIYEYRGRPIAQAIELRSAIEATPAGEQAIIKFRRSKSEMTATVQF